MKIAEEYSKVTQITSFPWHIAIFSIICTAFATIRIFYLLFFDKIQINDWVVIVSGLIAFFGGAAFCKIEITIFDIKSKNVYWSKKGIWSEKKGQVAFSDIQDILVQKRLASHNYLLRIAIKTHDQLIPITERYTQGKETTYQTIRNKILKTIS